MTHPDHIRAKAIELRIARRMTIDQIAERLSLPRTTIYAWVRDLPIERTRRRTEAQARAAAANADRYRLKREAAYGQGVAEYEGLADEPTFRDFVCLYLAEGCKRDRNLVAIANSDPPVLSVSAHWLRRLSVRPLWASLQYHADQDPVELQAFWAAHLELDDPGRVRLQRKSNSNQMAGRTWRSAHGVLTVGVHDTYLRSRLQAWMDRIRAEWT